MEELTLFNDKPRTAVTVRRDMAKMQNVMAILEPIERSIFLSTTAKTIYEYEAKELATDLAKAIRYIAKDIGYKITNENDFHYLVVRICEILKRYYAGFTLKDFRMAFEMCITGELDEYLPKGRDGHPDRSHYQQFNAEYVCKILNAYKVRRAKVLKKAYDATPEPSAKSDPEKEKGYRNTMRRNAIEAYNYYKENGRLPELSLIREMLCYNTLSEAGLAPEVVVTIEEQKVILKRTINRLICSGRFGDMRRLQKAGIDAPELQHDAFTLARRKVLKATFAKMVAEGKKIEDFVKFE